jgi:hypothetical protein
MGIEQIAEASLPGLVVLLLMLMRVQYILAVLRYEDVIRRLEEEVAFLRPAPGEEAP